MTSTFDSLERIFAHLERGDKPEFKERAERLAIKVQHEIESKVGKIKLPEWMEKENKWSMYFSTVHNRFDHTPQWHLRLVSRSTDAEIENLEGDMFKEAGI